MVLEKVIIDSSVIAEIIKFDSKIHGKETAGLLIGVHTNGIVYIDEMEVGEQTANAVHVEISDEALTNAVIKVSSREDGHVIVGWWHTHPGLSSFMSPTDVSTQERYQKLFPDAVGIVVDALKYTQTFDINDLDFGVYHLVNGQAQRVPYYVSRQNDSEGTLEDELRRLITGKLYKRKEERRPQVLQNSNVENVVVKRKSMKLEDIQEIRERIENMNYYLSPGDVNFIRTLLDLNEAIADGVINEVPVEVDNIIHQLEESTLEISKKVEMLKHLHDDARQTRAFILGIGAVALEFAIVWGIKFFLK